MTRPDIERIEAEQVLRRKFPKAQWGSEIVGDIDALLTAIDELTAEKAELKQKADGWIAQAEIWRTGNMKIVDKLRQSTSSYEDRIDELEAALDKTQQQCNEWRRAAKDVLAPQVQALEARNAKLEAVAVAAQILASREGKDGWCDDCGYRGHLAPCPWRALDAALDALDD